MSVQREDFATSQKLLERYQNAIEQRVREASAPEDCRSTLARTRELLEWVRRMTLVSRAKYQFKLGTLRDALQYMSAHRAVTAEPRFRARG